MVAAHALPLTLPQNFMLTASLRQHFDSAGLSWKHTRPETGGKTPDFVNCLRPNEETCWFQTAWIQEAGKKNTGTVLHDEH